MRPDDLAALGIEPLSARSVILSALLGTHPPTLPARALVALAELFGIRPGTTRTSLSRMLANGELVGDHGGYELAGRLLERQREQDQGQVVNHQAHTAEWSGEWITAIAASDRRSMAERRAFRQSMIGSRLAELRPDIWMRPANAAGPPRSADVFITTGMLDCDDVTDLVDRLWNLEHIETQAIRLSSALDRQRHAIDRGGVDELPQSFMVAAAVVRFLRTEPQLPTELAPRHWTAEALRSDYGTFNQALQTQLHAFFSSVR